MVSLALNTGHFSTSYHIEHQYTKRANRNLGISSIISWHRPPSWYLSPARTMSFPKDGLGISLDFCAYVKDTVFYRVTRRQMLNV